MAARASKSHNLTRRARKVAASQETNRTTKGRKGEGRGEAVPPTTRARARQRPRKAPNKKKVRRRRRAAARRSQRLRARVTNGAGAHAVLTEWMRMPVDDDPPRRDKEDGGEGKRARGGSGDTGGGGSGGGNTRGGGGGGDSGGGRDLFDKRAARGGDGKGDGVVVDDDPGGGDSDGDGGEESTASTAQPLVRTGWGVSCVCFLFVLISQRQQTCTAIQHGGEVRAGARSTRWALVGHRGAAVRWWQLAANASSCTLVVAGSVMAVNDSRTHLILVPRAGSTKRGRRGGGLEGVAPAATAGAGAGEASAGEAWICSQGEIAQIGEPLLFI